MKLFNYGFQNSIENITKSFFSKIYFGSIKVTFPSGNIAIFKGQKEGYSADIKIFNYKFVSKILKKKSVGLAEAYIDGYFTTANLTANRVLISSNTGKVGVSTVSNTELDFIIAEILMKKFKKKKYE